MLHCCMNKGKKEFCEMYLRDQIITLLYSGLTSFDSEMQRNTCLEQCIIYHHQESTELNYGASEKGSALQHGYLERNNNLGSDF